MKDHELRELINDVTAVAKIYAHTQQLREQIAHLIIPAFSKLECEKEFRRGMVEGKDVIIEIREAQITRQLTEIENLNRQLDFEAKQRTELRKDLEVAKGQYQGACDIIRQLERNITPPTPTPSSGNNP